MPNELSSFMFLPTSSFSCDFFRMLKDDFPQLAVRLNTYLESRANTFYLIPNGADKDLQHFGYACTFDNILNTGIGYPSRKSKNVLYNILYHRISPTNQAFICSYLHKESDPYVRRIQKTTPLKPIPKLPGSSGEVFEVDMSSVNPSYLLQEWPRIGGRNCLIVFVCPTSISSKSNLFIISEALDGEGFLICYSE